MSKDKYFGNHSIDSKALSITSDGGLDLAEIGSSNPVNIASGNSVVVKLGDNGGVQKLYIQDSGGIEQASINSNGAISGSSLYADNIECNTLDVDAITVPSGGLDLSSLNLEVSTLEVGGGYGSAGTTMNQHGAVSIDGDLTVDEQVFLNHEGLGAKRSKVWIGYEMLQVFDVVNHWDGAEPVSPGTAYGMFHSYGSETLRISLDDLPNEAVITSMGFSIYFNTMSSGGNATVKLELQALELPLGIAPTITPVDQVQIREVDLDAVDKPGWHIATINLNEDRSSTPLNIKAYQLDLTVHNGGAAESIILNGIWVNYVIPNLTPSWY